MFLEETIISVKMKCRYHSKLPNGYDLEGQNVDGVGKLMREIQSLPSEASDTFCIQ